MARYGMEGEMPRTIEAVIIIVAWLAISYRFIGWATQTNPKRPRGQSIPRTIQALPAVLALAIILFVRKAKPDEFDGYGE